jgi:hypothetical protein
MNPTRILPDLQCSLICEEVRQEANGNLFIIGVVTALRVPQVPVVAARLCLLNRWTSGLGQFRECSRLVAPDQMTVLSKSELKFELRDPGHAATGVTAFSQVKFDTAGTYYIEVLVDEVMKLRYPLVVILTPQPNPQPQPAGA